MEDRRLLAKFSKNSIETIKVISYSWKGIDLIDVRAWVQQNPADPTSEIATKKGLTIRQSSLLELLEALQKAQEMLEKGVEGACEQRSQDTPG